MSFTFGGTTFNDGMPLKGVRSEHLADRLILPSHLSAGLFGAVGQISVIDPDDPAAAGATGLLADAGHQHAWTCAAPIEISGTTNNEGTASTGARSDHDHAFPSTDPDVVLTSETTTSGSFTDLATTGPSVTMTPPASGKVLVHIGCNLLNSGANFSIMGFALSSGNTLAASDDNCIALQGTDGAQFGQTFELTGLAVSSTLFRAKYHVTAGTGTFARRRLIVQPLPS